ncbi:MAG: hypothetical protein K0Q79_1037 [Flavipsychrobacter sp.]|jgi:hypothetical protein|nr:hypothetical protein [Flavipsychrobacter sp.]
MEKTQELFLSGLAYPVIKEIILPKIKKIFNEYEVPNEIIESEVIEDFNEYFRRRHEKFSIIDTLVFPNKQTLFNSLYQPLTLALKTNNNEYIDECKIENFPENLIKKYHRIVIQDTAGMGKSTLMKKIFLSAIDNNIGIPVLVELRQLNSANDIWSELKNQFSTINKKIDVDFLVKMVKKGDFIFLLDGLDEISKADREFVLKDIRHFTNQVPNNYVFISSRPEDILAAFGDFQKLVIKPLDREEAFELIERYDFYSYKPIAIDLIDVITKNDDEGLNEYLANPFLVSLLYKAFEYKKDIPLKKSQFYRQVYDALFETHDLSKEGYFRRKKDCNLHIDDFDRVLRFIAYASALKNQVEYNKDQIISIIDNAKQFLFDLTFKSSDFLADLLTTVPLFRAEGNNVKWAHKSLQDYFAAKFIWIDLKERQEEALRNIYDDPSCARFHNMLDTFYELDPNVFEETFLFWLLSDFQNYVETSYAFNNINKEKLIRRIENCFSKNFQIAYLSDEEHKKFLKNHRVTNKYCLPGYENSGALFFYPQKPKGVIISFHPDKKNYSVILDIIANKFPAICEYRRHESRIDDVVNLQKGEKYIINDSIDNVLNSPELFSQTTLFTETDYVFKYHDALNHLEKLIKNKKQKEQQKQIFVI